jgi:hypothetical protein
VPDTLMTALQAANSVVLCIRGSLEFAGNCPLQDALCSLRSCSLERESEAGLV